jgi:AAA15 family ATPase/GTPase
LKINWILQYICKIFSIFADIKQIKKEFGMLLEFSVSNFRSIKNEQTLSLIAEKTQAKPDNFEEITLSGGETGIPVAVLKSAVIYGANASGKSNVIKAFQAFVQFIKTSALNQVGDAIRFYDPFLFEQSEDPIPTTFKMTFIGDDKIKYYYEVSFKKYEIVSEKLDYSPKGQRANLFERSNEIRETDFSHTVVLSRNISNRTINKTVFKNQLYLSKFGNEIVHEQLTPIFVYFKKIDIWNSLDKDYIQDMQKLLMDELSENKDLLNRLKKLIRISDTKIEDVRIEKLKRNRPISNNEFISSTVYNLYGQHSVYSEGEKIGDQELPFREESAGSNVLFTVGGFILKKLESGSILFIDELDNSLHPKLTKFLVKLFNNPVSNPKNAQLVCATHEVTLLDKDVFRMDQVWFTEKNKYGATELYSIKDFDGIRDGIPFDKWYSNGKFGGEPKIKEIDFIFGNE